MRRFEANTNGDAMSLGIIRKDKYAELFVKTNTRLDIRWSKFAIPVALIRMC